MPDVFKRAAGSIDYAVLFFRAGDARVHPCLELCGKALMDVFQICFRIFCDCLILQAGCHPGHLSLGTPPRHSVAVTGLDLVAVSGSGFLFNISVFPVPLLRQCFQCAYTVFRIRVGREKTVTLVLAKRIDDAVVDWLRQRLGSAAIVA